MHGVRLSWLIHVFSFGLFLGSGYLPMAEVSAAEVRAEISESEKEGEHQGYWSLRLGLLRESEGLDQLAAAVGRLRLRGEMGLVPSAAEASQSVLAVAADGRFDFVSQRSQNYYLEPLENRFAVDELVLRYRIQEGINLRLGAVAQKIWQDEIVLAGRQPFLGGVFQLARQSLGAEKFGFALGAFVPPSNSTHANLNEVEALPRVFVGQAEYRRITGPFELSAQLNFWDWRELPSTVAWQGQLLGNRTNGLAEPATDFSSDFQVLRGGAHLSYRGGPETFGVGLRLGGNRGAPDRFDRSGEVDVTVASSRWAGRRSMISYRRFFLEADAAPAPYTLYGTNRVGERWRAEVIWERAAFTTVLEWVRRSPINPLPSQAEAQSILLSLETSRAIF